MTLETAQLLCSPFPPGTAPYRRTHFNHPCSIWTRASRGNYLWLCTHGEALAEEYTYRFGKIHRSAEVIRWCLANSKRLRFPEESPTAFAVVMDESFKVGGPVSSYRNFYRHAKSRFARWERNRTAPRWYTTR